MKPIELVGGPLDGAVAQDRGDLHEGDHVLVEPEEAERVVYTMHDGILEYDPAETFGGDA